MAESLDESLTGEKRFQKLFRSFDYKMEVPFKLTKARMTRAQFIPVDARKSNFMEISLGYTGEQARIEAERCLRCDVRERKRQTYKRAAGRNKGDAMEAKTITINVDGLNLEVDPDKNLIDACGKAGAKIPTLCFMKDISSNASCGGMRRGSRGSQGTRAFLRAEAFPRDEDTYREPPGPERAKNGRWNCSLPITRPIVCLAYDQEPAN